MQKKKQKGANAELSACKKCGTCCKKGGPALHKEDKEILSAGHIGTERLITIRKGEFAFSPLSGKLEPIQSELVKIAGKGKGWTCSLYNEQKSLCMIYTHRPLECRLLRCWDTKGILSVIGKDTLTRADILAPDDPIIQYIEIHEKECSPQVFEDLISALGKNNNDVKSKARLAHLIELDLALRSKAVSEFGLSLEAELFLFGRPLFKILNLRGLQLMG